MHTNTLLHCSPLRVIRPEFSGRRQVADDRARNGRSGGTGKWVGLGGPGCPKVRDSYREAESEAESSVVLELAKLAVGFAYRRGSV